MNNRTKELRKEEKGEERRKGGREGWGGREKSFYIRCLRT